MLKLSTKLAACKMGSDQQDVAEWIENHEQWLAFVDRVNLEGIKENGNGEPHSDWIDDFDFHPDQLIPAACKALKWYSVPESSCIIMSFYQSLELPSILKKQAE